jgi:phospholipase/carboxylesterase
MQAERHDGGGLKYMTILPDGYDPGTRYPLVIMLHGFGANMQDLAGLAPAINQRGYVYAFPNAPLPFDLGGGYTGWGWTPRGADATPENIRDAEDLLGEFFGKVFQQLNVEPGRALLMGFSQGGGMTYRCGLERNSFFAGLAALSATLPDRDLLAAKLPESRDQKIFIAHGRLDPTIAVDRAVAAKDFLEEAGYTPEYHEYDMGHEISPQELKDLIPWMARVLPPTDQAPD